jgi:hypothetical protein
MRGALIWFRGGLVAKGILPSAGVDCGTAEGDNRRLKAETSRTENGMSTVPARKTSRQRFVLEAVDWKTW